MTNEQLERAKSIQAEIYGYKKELDMVCDYQDRIPEVCSKGICIANGLNYNTRIFPREEEMSTLLVTMRNRLENRISELEREFAEL